MHDGSLYPERGVGGGFNVDVQLDPKDFEKICNAEIGDEVSVDATAVRGYSGNQGQVFIKREYDQFFTDGITLDEVKVSVHNHPTATGAGGDGNLYTENARITITGIRS